ncbi:esterase/lipase [Paraconexibacter sp. AEG42_29]|uniref:Esterase/lipase n=1 Tax=Paraconexibacter sp. AEG42_29 TaxID=2997339 RepID=A0AAU7AZ42_9ACTN
MRTRSRPGLWVEDRGPSSPDVTQSGPGIAGPSAVPGTTHDGPANGPGGSDGRPEAVLFITGWTISSAVFDPIAARYTGAVRLITYDHRGSGRSAAWPAPVSMAMLAADAARVLDDRGIAAAHVVGLSMGAAVGLELAVRMPSRVKSLVLIGGGPGGPLTRTPAPLAVARTVGELAGDLGAARWPAAVLFSRRFRAEQPDRVCELCRPFARHRPPPWTTGFQTVAASCFARHGSLARVRAPTLVLHGDEDAMSPVANAQLLARGIPGAELRLMRGCGHAVPLERDAETADLLLGWFDRHAAVVPPSATSWDRAAERATRPFALQAGMLRNTRQLTPAVWQRFGWP